MLRAAGFTHIHVTTKPQSAAYIKEWLPGSQAEDYVVSANVTAIKPADAAAAAAAAATSAAATFAAATSGAAREAAAAAAEQMPSRMLKAIEKQAADASC